MNDKEQTLNTVQKFLTAMGERDLNAILELFDHDVDWYIPGNQDLAPWLGRRSSREQVREFFTILWLETEPISARVDHVFTVGSAAVITGEFSTKILRTSKTVDSLFVIHITVADGLIVRYRLLEDTLAVAVALGS